MARNPLLDTIECESRRPRRPASERKRRLTTGVAGDSAFSISPPERGCTCESGSSKQSQLRFPTASRRPLLGHQIARKKELTRLTVEALHRGDLAVADVRASGIAHSTLGLLARACVRRVHDAVVERGAALAAALAALTVTDAATGTRARIGRLGLRRLGVRRRGGARRRRRRGRVRRWWRRRTGRRRRWSRWRRGVRRLNGRALGEVHDRRCPARRSGWLGGGGSGRVRWCPGVLRLLG